VSDRSSVSLLGPMATPQQLLNAQVATCLYHCWTKLEKLMEEHTESVSNTIGLSLTVRECYSGLPSYLRALSENPEQI